MCCCRFHSWWKRIEGLVEGGGMDKGQPQEKGKEEVEGGGIDGTTDGASSPPFRRGEKRLPVEGSFVRCVLQSHRAIKNFWGFFFGRSLRRTHLGDISTAEENFYTDLFWGEGFKN